MMMMMMMMMMMIINNDASWALIWQGHSPWDSKV
jgi:hypothetical protein